MADFFDNDYDGELHYGDDEDDGGLCGDGGGPAHGCRACGRVYEQPQRSSCGAATRIFTGPTPLVIAVIAAATIAMSRSEFKGEDFAGFASAIKLSRQDREWDDERTIDDARREAAFEYIYFNWANFSPTDDVASLIDAALAAAHKAGEDFEESAAAAAVAAAAKAAEELAKEKKRKKRIKDKDKHKDKTKTGVADGDGLKDAASGGVITDKDQGEASSDTNVARRAPSAPAAMAADGTNADEAAGERETAPKAMIETLNAGKSTASAEGGPAVAAIWKPNFNQTCAKEGSDGIDNSDAKGAGDHMNGTPLGPGPKSVKFKVGGVSCGEPFTSAPGAGSPSSAVVNARLMTRGSSGASDAASPSTVPA